MGGPFSFDKKCLCAMLSCALLSVLLLRASYRVEMVQPVFFSMIFPQLNPFGAPEMTAGEAVLL